MTEPQSALLLRRQLAGNETLVLTAAGCLASDGTCGNAAVAVIQTVFLKPSTFTLTSNDK